MQKSMCFRYGIKSFSSLLGFLFVFLLPATYAQKAEVGLRGGFHTGTFSPKEKFYKGTWDRTSGVATDLFGRLQVSDHLYVQLGVGYYQRSHKGSSEVSSFQGGFELEGEQSIYNFQFMFGYRTKQENKKIYGFGAFGYAFGLPFDRSFNKAIWFKSPVKVQLNGEESTLILEAGLGYQLSKRLKTELSLRYLPTQFNTSQESLTVLVPNLNSNWNLNALCPGITLIFH